MERRTKSKIIDVSFISHCDDPHCDLGSANFNCPLCGGRNVDYGKLWWSKDMGNGYNFKKTCEKCNETFELYKIGFGVYEIKHNDNN